MSSAMRTLYRVWTVVLFLAVIVQIGAAGFGAFYADQKVGAGTKKILTQKQFDHGFSLHDGLGYLIFLASVLLFLFALSARLGRRRVLLALAVPLLVVVQIALAIIGEKTPAVGVLHPVNAFIIAGVTGMLAHSAWRGEAARSAAGAAAT